MRELSIGILPADGVGPEVIGAARAVLEVAGGRFGFRCRFAEGLIGQAALNETGKALPPETLRLCQEVEATLVGPVGRAPSGFLPSDLADHPLQGVLKLRAWLGAFASLRPVRQLPALERRSPLKEGVGRLNLMIVHDDSSGLPYGTPRGFARRDGEMVAVNTLSYSSAEIERTARVAFAYAEECGYPLTAIDHSKLLETGQLWRETVGAIGREDYPEVPLRHVEADNFCYDLVVHPAAFRLVLAEVTTGELIAQLAAGLTGSYAIHPVAHVGGRVSIYQPSHGSAPMLAGRHTADPLGAVRAGALMLGHSFGMHEAEGAIERAVEEALLRARRRRASGEGELSTEALTETICEALGGSGTPA